MSHDPKHEERVYLYALQALPADERRAAEAEIAACADCRRDLEELQRLAGDFVGWPTDVLRPPTPLWDRLASRIGTEAGVASREPAASMVARAEWEEVAPDISVKLLATDTESRRVSMLVRLAPNTDYPPHLHAGLEELHLLDGELVINERTLAPGDFSRAEAGSRDHRVWSATGCTCLLVTSPDDVLG